MSALDDIIAKATARLAEVEAEAAALRAIIQAAGGKVPALPAAPPQFVPMPYPVPQAVPSLPLYDPLGPLVFRTGVDAACAGAIPTGDAHWNGPHDMQLFAGTVRS